MDIDIYRSLMNAGVAEPDAHQAAGAIRQDIDRRFALHQTAGHSAFATKVDLAHLRTDVTAEIAELRAEVHGVRAEVSGLRADVGQRMGEMQSQFSQQMSEVHQRISHLEAESSRGMSQLEAGTAQRLADMQRWLVATIVGAAALVGAFVRLTQ
jgi:hypothetical protein